MDNPEITQTNPENSALVPLEDAQFDQGKPGNPIAVIAGVVLFITGILALGILPRLQRQSQLNALAKSVNTDIHEVNVVQPKLAASSTQIALPGSIQGITETAIYSRTDGYLNRRFVDIGDRVSARQLLATISAPEADQNVQQAIADLAKAKATVVQAKADLAQRVSSLSQAKATYKSVEAQLSQAKSSLKLARITWLRWQKLQKQGAVSKQEADQYQTAFEVAKANVSTIKAQLAAANDNIKTAVAAVTSQQANITSLVASVASSESNLQRLKVLQSFERINAPYSGIITARNVDNGALIAAGSDVNSGNAWLFKIAATSSLRIVINVPQKSVQSIHTGQLAQVSVRQLPNRTFTGVVVRNANSLDPSSNTLVTEVQVQNPDNLLRPGMYSEVTFTASRPNPPLLLPANTLVINALGTQVATVTPDNTVHFHKVELGRDYGNQVEVLSGLGENVNLIANPTSDLQEGTKVKVLASKSDNNS